MRKQFQTHNIVNTVRVQSPGTFCNNATRKVAFHLRTPWLDRNLTEKELSMSAVKPLRPEDRIDVSAEISDSYNCRQTESRLRQRNPSGLNHCVFQWLGDC